MKNNEWKSYLCLEIVEKMNRFAVLNFKIPPYWATGEGLWRPSPLARSGPLAPPSSLSVCSWHFEIFRPCILAPLKFKMADGAILKIVKSPYLNEWELDLLQLHFVQREGAWADTWRHLLTVSKCNSPPVNGQCTNYLMLFNVAL